MGTFMHVLFKLGELSFGITKKEQALRTFENNACRTLTMETHGMALDAPIKFHHSFILRSG